MNTCTKIFWAGTAIALVGAVAAAYMSTDEAQRWIWSGIAVILAGVGIWLYGDIEGGLI